jgi:hypothetical protein
VAKTRRYSYGFSTGSTPEGAAKYMDTEEIKSEENTSETNFSFDCNIAQGA